MLLLRLLDHAALRALTGGVLYSLLMLSVDRLARLAERSIRSHGAAHGHLRRVHLWAGIAQVLATAAATGFVFALLLEGTFAANDVGLIAIDWPLHGPWLAVLVAGTIGLIAFFWAPYFSKVPVMPEASYPRAGKRPEIASTRVPFRGDEPSALLNTLTDEATLTVFRAASIPLLGPYWGVWLGLGWSLGLRSLRQRRRHTALSSDQRGLYYLASVLDWLAATLFIVTGSVWACLLGRIVGHAAVQLVYRWSTGRRARSMAPASEAIAMDEEAPAAGASWALSGEDEGQDDQRGEHDRSQDGDTLQVT